ncbi:MAG: helix-turn-helix domain-containing protein [Planctomycetota bacterium]
MAGEVESGAEGTPKIVPMAGSVQRAVSRQQAGAMLGVSWKTIERLVNRGELKAFKVLGQWRILLSEIDAYVQHQAEQQQKRVGA